MLADRLGRIRARVAAAAERAGRSPDEVTLVAVSKHQPIEKLVDAYAAGQRDFGESRAQELREKADAMPGDVRWHFVGPLQRNKMKVVRPIAHLCQSFDRADVAHAWVEGDLPSPPVLLQVNVAAEPQKRGVLPQDAAAAVEQLAAAGVRCVGVMTLPPMVADAEDARPHFRNLRALRDSLATRWPEVRELSMGMSGDFEVAVEEGATIVRVGTALFGTR